MALYSCLKVFDDAPMASTPFVQTITGIIDARTNVAFAGHTFLFYSAMSPLNEVYRLSPFGSTMNTGIARNDTDGFAQGSGDVSVFGVKITSGCGLGRYSVVTNGPYPFFGGSILDYAYISAVTTGSFDLTWVSRTVAALTVSRFVLVLGGDDWNIDLSNDTWNTVHAATDAPAGVLLPMAMGHISDTLTTGTGAGGSGQGIGWATRDGIYGCATYRIDLENGRIQLHDRTPVNLDASTLPVTQTSGVPIVSSWDASSWSGSGAGGSTGAADTAKMTFSGTGIVCKAGTFDLPAVDGSFTVDLGLDPQFIVFASVGMPDSTDPDGTQASVAIGYTDRVHLGGIWTGENEPFVTADVQGCNLLSDQFLISTATPDGVSTVMANQMTMAPITDESGIISLTVTDTDGTEPNVIWFAVGVATTPPAPPPTPVFRTREVVRRRLRRAPIVWSEQGGLQTRVRINLFAVDMQPGVGTADTPDPQVMVRASKDGGSTWSNERMVSAGRVGEYFERLNTWRWGQGREWVFEVACTDPVTWNLLGAYFDAEAGES